MTLYWTVVAALLVVKCLYVASSYLYNLVSGGVLPEIAPTNPVAVLIQDNCGWTRIVYPPLLEARLLQAFWVCRFEFLVAIIH